MDTNDKQTPQDAIRAEIDSLEAHLFARGFRIESVPGSMPGEPARVIQIRDDEAVPPGKSKVLDASALLWSLLIDLAEGSITLDQFQSFGGDECRNELFE
ncbi:MULTISPECIES: hypothetical protein [Paraburkholderia]|uniref:Uncharacterized protein n=1 Tax=Paraburkholderia madseniana TaxID=2599607 RepID=A0AAP5ES32_9BURK|nr:MULTISPECIES: hypothetical protein [Paraburkholderia]MCX4150993.1 hypothetical protein [Paraburkholderia madseniana]MCX4176633.1 hypothetical protein [Paraburkholderia madseniana]MDN7153926.1 hypothetical protein [Paraburkholderia sp. WS6]MDQ6412808.1 hypothetical protein [Paraburkholderia madseniana]MDQ6464625.1 hypothetical protein [Paraburkholderia madseniana]